MRKAIVVGIIMLTSSILFGAMPERFKQCKACHGERAEKLPNGASRVINTMSSHQIESILKNFRNSTCGDNVEHALGGLRDDSCGDHKKALMRAHAFKLTNREIKQLSLYIPSLK